MGDFNVNMSDPANKQLLNFMKNHHLLQIINNVTTDYNTTIDLIFTNLHKIGNFSSGILECYYSYHKPIWMSFPKQLLQ